MYSFPGYIDSLKRNVTEIVRNGEDSVRNVMDLMKNVNDFTGNVCFSVKYQSSNVKYLALISNSCIWRYYRFLLRID